MNENEKEEENEVVRTEQLINDYDVTRFIDSSISEESGTTITQKVASLFCKIYAHRRTNDPTNFDFAAAEYYTYARLLTGITGDPIADTNPNTVHIQRRVFALLSLREIFLDDGELQEPPRSHLLKWSQNGARQGLVDWGARNPGKPKNHGASVRILTDPQLSF